MRNDLAVILDSLRHSLSLVVAILPHLAVAVVLLVVGWLLARSLRWLAIRVLRLIRLDVAAERTGFDDFLIRGGVRLTVVSLVGQMLYWGTLLIFVIAVFNVLGLTMGPDLVARLGGFVPKVGAAMAILVIGSLAARFIRGLAEAYLNNVGVKLAAGIGLLVQVALIAFVATLALEQLGMAVNLLVSTFQLAFGALCLAVAIAFGFGGRKWAESFLERNRPKR